MFCSFLQTWSDVQLVHRTHIVIRWIVFYPGITLAVSITSTFTYSLTTRVVGALQVTSQPVSPILLCTPLTSGTWLIPGLSIPWCCLPTSSAVFLPFFSLPCKMILARHDELETCPRSRCTGRWRFKTKNLICFQLDTHWSNACHLARLPDREKSLKIEWKYPEHPKCRFGARKAKEVGAAFFLFLFLFWQSL